MAFLARLRDVVKGGGHGTAGPSFPTHGFSTAASFIGGAATFPFSYRQIFAEDFIKTAYCDAGVAAEPVGLPDFRTVLGALNHDSVKHVAKEYNFELKPLLSAFGAKALSATTLRALLLYYLPLLEPRPPSEDMDDLFEEPQDENNVDLITPLQNSIKQVARETSIVTTRRVMERVIVDRVSRRAAWKLLKDASKSAKRKAVRGLPAPVYTFSVARTTFRAHCLGVAASWAVQVAIEVYRCFVRSEDSDDTISEKLALFGRKVYSTTIKCGASLICASIGAGIGALIHPSTGQWLGCVIGDFAGPIIAVIAFERLNLRL